MDKILISDLLVQAVIGVYEAERQKAQEIWINLALDVDLSRAALSDDLADTLDYAVLADRLRRYAENVRRFTLEALANDLARLCLEDQRVIRVKIRVDKPGAILFAKSAGVEIDRSQPE